MDVDNTFNHKGQEINQYKGLLEVALFISLSVRAGLDSYSFTIKPELKTFFSL